MVEEHQKMHKSVMPKNFQNIPQELLDVEQHLNNNSWKLVETKCTPENIPSSPVDSLVKEKFRNRIKTNTERSSSHISNLWKRREDVDRILGKPDYDASSSDDSLTTKDLLERENQTELQEVLGKYFQKSNESFCVNIPSDDSSDKTLNTSSISISTSKDGESVPEEVEKLNTTRYSNVTDFPESSIVDFSEDFNQNSKCKENGTEPSAEKESILPGHHSENLMLFTPKIFMENELVVFGQIVISKIAFLSIKNLLNVKERFMLLVHSGKRSFETEVVATDDNGRLEFVKDIILNDLDNDFEFVLKLCCKTEEKLIVPKPKISRLFSVKRLFTRKKNLNRKVSNTCTESPYKPVGTCKINFTNLRGIKMLEFTENGQHSSICRAFELEFSEDIIFRGCTTGYLSIAAEINDSLNWNYYWCTLDGYEFKYYNYPLQETPEGTIDLRYCVDAYISEPKREMCPRVKTLLVEVGQNRRGKDKTSLLTICHSHSTILMYLLSTDSKSEFEKWKKKLNMVLLAIRNWNKTKFSLRFTKVTEL